METWTFFMLQNIKTLQYDKNTSLVYITKMNCIPTLSFFYKTNKNYLDEFFLSNNRYILIN